MKSNLELAEEYFLPEGSYNAECTLKSAWDSKEIMIDSEVIKNSSDILKSLLNRNLAIQIEEEFKD